MKKSFHVFQVVLLTILLASCEKVIDVDLEESAPQLVFEANLIEGNQIFEVRLSESRPYFEASEEVYVNDATVSLTNSEGLEWVLLFQGEGLYATEVDAAADELYTLNIEIDGKEYTSSSYLHEAVELTEVYSEFQEEQGPIDEGYLVYFRYLDPIEQSNYYRVVYYLNGEIQTEGDDLQVLNDDLNNGSEARFPLFQKVFDPGDELVIELRHIDEPAYEYFNSLADIVGSIEGPGAGSAAPGNPIGNWSSPDVLGHFTAYSYSQESIVIP